MVITPACGFVNANGSILIGIAAGLVPFFACYKLKGWLGYDDALDTFGVHAVGGTLGAFLTGVLATADVNANLGLNLSGIVGKTLWLEQLKAIGVTLTMAIIGTTAIAYLVNALVGLRVDEEVESVGLDLAEHGEEGYHGGSMSGHMSRPSHSSGLGLEGIGEAIRGQARGNEAV